MAGKPGDPTLEEIETLTAEIRSTWTPAVEAARRLGTNQEDAAAITSWSPPVIPAPPALPLPLDATLDESADDG